MEDFKELASRLAQRFVDEGFIVHRYDAYSSKSVYLKLDYGACCSIRISDHPGYKHLKYRYNIGSNIEQIKHDESGEYPRHYYPTSKSEKMIGRILHDRDYRIKKYGEDGYRKIVSRNKMKAARARTGFFSHCKLVGGAVDADKPQAQRVHGR